MAPFFDNTSSFPSSAPSIIAPGPELGGSVKDCKRKSFYVYASPIRKTPVDSHVRPSKRQRPRGIFDHIVSESKQKQSSVLRSRIGKRKARQQKRRSAPSAAQALSAELSRRLDAAIFDAAIAASKESAEEEESKRQQQLKEESDRKDLKEKSERKEKESMTTTTETFEESIARFLSDAEDLEESFPKNPIVGPGSESDGAAAAQNHNAPPDFSDPSTKQLRPDGTFDVDMLNVAAEPTSKEYFHILVAAMRASKQTAEEEEERRRERRERRMIRRYREGIRRADEEYWAFVPRELMKDPPQ